MGYHLDMGRKSAWIISALLLAAMLIGCDLSQFLGTSVMLLNSSDAPVAAAVIGTDFSETIEAGGRSAPISVTREIIENSSITIELDGIYYSSRERQYQVKEEIDLAPDCCWLAVTNATGETISDLHPVGDTEDPRAEQDWNAKPASSLGGGGTAYIPIIGGSGKASSVSLQFKVGGISASAATNSQISMENGHTLSLSLEKNESGGYALSL